MSLEVSSTCTMSPCMTSKWAKRSGALYVDCGMVRQQVRTVELPCRGLPNAADNNRARRLFQTSPRGEGFHEEEANTFKGNPADARRAGTVPGRRRRERQRRSQPGAVPLVSSPEL